MRYKEENEQKANGVVYTPTEMADYLSEKLVKYSKFEYGSTVAILDPAVGAGELLISIITKIKRKTEEKKIKAIGYETDPVVAKNTQINLRNMFPEACIEIINDDFLTCVDSIDERFDFIIANPPYIRTQILGSDKAQEIATKLNLSGRVDIYYAFLLTMKQVLSTVGIAGYITSNKFFTIKSGKCVRDFMTENYSLLHITDFGDTKLFSASVLPCIIIFELGKSEDASKITFTSIYETKKENIGICDDIFDVIENEGIYKTSDERKFLIKQGNLQSVEKGELWTIASNENKEWLRKIESKAWMRFSDIGKIRVGIKTTADNVFIGEDWSGDKQNLELLQPLVTHRDAGQIVSSGASWKVLYTHRDNNGKKEVYDINQYPLTKAYLEKHREQLEGRTYVKKANRLWYEIWVPQNPSSWKKRKIVFRDISEKPQFWLDESGAIINGDCYWIEINDDVFEETIYLALAIANSSFIEKYYDIKFNTKLYSGKRRYMTQYVEQFPIPTLSTPGVKEAIELVKSIVAGTVNETESCYMKKLDDIVNTIFA